jgi:hypothetical protein
MAHETKLTSDKGSMQQRIADRMKSSGAGTNPDVMVKHGTGPTRTVTHIHHSSSQERRDGGMKRGGSDAA